MKKQLSMCVHLDNQESPQSIAEGTSGYGQKKDQRECEQSRGSATIFLVLTTYK